MNWPTAIVIVAILAFLGTMAWAMIWGAVKLNGRKEDDPPR
jgi:hypothetical protein